MSGEMDRRQSFLQLMASMHDPVDPDLFRDLVAAHNVLGDEETTTNSSSQQSHQEQEILWDPPLLDGIVLSSSENEDRVCPTNGVQMRTAMEGGTGGALAAIPVPDKLPHSETNGDCLEGSSRSANSKRYPTGLTKHCKRPNSSIYSFEYAWGFDGFSINTDFENMRSYKK